MVHTLFSGCSSQTGLYHILEKVMQWIILLSEKIDKEDKDTYKIVAIFHCVYVCGRKQ